MTFHSIASRIRVHCFANTDTTEEGRRGSQGLGQITSHWETRLASATSQAARQLAALRKARTTGPSPEAGEGTGARRRGSGGSKRTTVAAAE